MTYSSRAGQPRTSLHSGGLCAAPWGHFGTRTGSIFGTRTGSIFGTTIKILIICWPFWDQNWFHFGTRTGSIFGTRMVPELEPDP